MSEIQNKDPLFRSKKMRNFGQAALTIDEYETAPVAIRQPGLFDVSHETFGLTPLRVLLNLEALFELATGSINIIASRIADRGLNTAGLKTTLEIFNLVDR